MWPRLFQDQHIYRRGKRQPPLLLFLGDSEGKPSCAFNELASKVEKRGDTYSRYYLERYTPECDCPESELFLIKVLTDREFAEAMQHVE